jgi:hypothetical protein
MEKTNLWCMTIVMHVIVMHSMHNALGAVRKYYFPSRAKREAREYARKQDTWELRIQEFLGN